MSGNSRVVLGSGKNFSVCMKTQSRVGDGVLQSPIIISELNGLLIDINYTFSQFLSY